jgi:hypothetical protein
LRALAGRARSTRGSAANQAHQRLDLAVDRRISGTLQGTTLHNPARDVASIDPDGLETRARARPELSWTDAGDPKRSNHAAKE